MVVAHPNGGSKDQVAGLYAQKLAEAGFITIAFDARYQGESGGEPCRTDKPANRMGDIMGAVDFIQNYPGVDPERIGAFGICGGGGYTFATDHADLIDQPLLVIAGEIADSRYMSEEAFAKASRTADKELYIVPGATHIRTYFVEEYVDQISAKIQGFYTQKL